MRALILGVGDAFTRRHFSTSAVLEAPGGYVLVDCPDLVHRALHEAAARAGWTVDALSVHDILLTHLHGDHCNGLESFGFMHRLQGPQPPSPPRIHTSRPAADRLWERLAPAMDAAHTDAPRDLADFFDLRVLEPGTPAEVAGLTVRCRFTTHGLPTIALLVSDGRSTLGWSSDTPFERELVEWLGEADVIVHESNRGRFHTPIEELEALPEALRARIRLIHVPDDFDASSTSMPVLAEGDVLEL